ncbi:MAG: DUF3307 domain-containing protein [Candidatus Pacearchaeota archaeon]|nr:DUF3307 domain-containing protein [Candidatus Pacearchaeota archaeon]
MDLCSRWLILIFVHAFSDFFLQPGKLAREKTKKFSCLLLHSIQYILPFLFLFFFMKISFFWLPILFVSHLLIDNYALVKAWNKLLGRKRTPDWLLVIEDQILHLTVLLFVARWPSL